MVEQIEEFDSELSVEPLLEREILEDGEVYVLEAIVAENVAAHGAKGSSLRRNHGRAAGNEAASCR